MTAGEVERLGGKANGYRRSADTLPEVADALLGEYLPDELASPKFVGAEEDVAVLRCRWPRVLHSELMHCALRLLDMKLPAFIQQDEGCDVCIILRPIDVKACATQMEEWGIVVSYLKPDPDLGSALAQYRLKRGDVPMRYVGFDGRGETNWLFDEIFLIQPVMDECLAVMFG